MVVSFKHGFLMLGGLVPLWVRARSVMSFLMFSQVQVFCLSAAL